MQRRRTQTRDTTSETNHVVEESDNWKGKKKQSDMSVKDLVLYATIVLQFVFIGKFIMGNSNNNETNFNSRSVVAPSLQASAKKIEGGDSINDDISSSIDNNREVTNSKPRSIVAAPLPQAPANKIEGGDSINNDDTPSSIDNNGGEEPEHVFVSCSVSSRHSGGPLLPHGILEITLRPDLAPKACAGFLHLLENNFFDGTYFFRVIPGMGAQVGYNPNFSWQGVREWKRKEITDTKHAGSLSNTRGTISFAARSTEQIFINTKDNPHLDHDYSNGIPFATVSQRSMESVVDRLYTGYEAGMGEIPTIQAGEDAVAKKFPKMSWIQHCHTVREVFDPEFLQNSVPDPNNNHEYEKYHGQQDHRARHDQQNQQDHLVRHDQRNQQNRQDNHYHKQRLHNAYDIKEDLDQLQEEQQQRQRRQQELQRPQYDETKGNKHVQEEEKPEQQRQRQHGKNDITKEHEKVQQQQHQQRLEGNIEHHQHGRDIIKHERKQQKEKQHKPKPEYEQLQLQHGRRWQRDEIQQKKKINHEKRKHYLDEIDKELKKQERHPQQQLHPQQQQQQQQQQQHDKRSGDNESKKGDDYFEDDDRHNENKNQDDFLDDDTAKEGNLRGA